MIRNASMLKRETFTMLDALEAYQRPEQAHYFPGLTMPQGELRTEEIKRRLGALPPALRGGEVLPQRVTAEELVLTQPCRDCAGFGLTESVEGVYTFCQPCNGTGRVLKRKSKRESILARMATILLTLTLLAIGAWWALVRWDVL